jgi:hypothetical protein
MHERLACPSAARTLEQGHSEVQGGRLALEAVTVVEHLDWGALTGTIVFEGGLVFDPPSFLRSGATFIVTSGPCTLAEGGRCVGRWPGGYGPNEDCAIVVAGSAGGVLGGCPVFDTDCVYGNTDYGADCLHPNVVYRSGRHAHGGADCPAGAVLEDRQNLAWHSDGETQGDNENGLPRSEHGAGGGWQICFA